MNNLLGVWKKFLEKNKVLVTIIVMIILTILVIFWTQIGLEEDYQKFLDADKSPKIEIGKPEYVDYENIKTTDGYIYKDNNSKYSQVKIKNISDEDIYDIRINLRTQETNSDGEFLCPSYILSRLKKGEVAVLSEQHENISDKEPLELSSFYYRDSSNNYMSHKISTQNEDPISDMIFEGESSKELKPLTKNIDIITINTVEIIELQNKNIYEIELKNNINEALNNIYITFIAYDQGNVIGERYVSVDKLEKEAKIIKLEVNAEQKLDLSKYGYSIDNFEKKQTEEYTIYIDNKSYSTYSNEFEEVEENHDRALKRYYISLIAFFIIRGLQKNLKTKASDEPKPKYISEIKYLNYAKWILGIIVIINLIQMF